MKRRFLYSESRLSEVTGISRIVLKKLRLEMVKGKEWRKSKKGKGGSIELSEKAVEIILKTFGLTDTDITRARLHFGKTVQSTSDPKQEEPTVTPMLSVEWSDPPILKCLTVTFIPPNIHILHAKNGSEEYKVIVPSNRVWAIGNPLRAKVSARHIGFMELASKAPRWPGDKMFLFNEGFV